MGASENLHQMDATAADSEQWVIAGIALRAPMKPIFTKSVDKRGAEDELSTTPTSAESRIPRSLPCPPAPKKRKPASSRRHCGGVREFFNPPDLETIFIRRFEGA
ncbi:UNVERIFIED_CONTAM: Cyclin-dependent protein kinase inhibitor SMR8 [Sesamum calycinum]|uniref:Cyclin-dependent protein kinase inhibitor SMR8 n=3 Tax=Sesamum TaxID=4181 RepID=A0AAE2BYU6_9LAMI|nr:Cyclin-dependent protein kinase inhibitor SMR8 [Sesamum angolense]